MRRYFWVAIVGLGVMIAAGCRSQRPVEAVQAPRPVTSLPAGSFTSQWDAALELPAEDTVRQLWLRGDLLFVRTQRNTVYQFDAASGELQSVMQPAKAGVKLRAPIVTPDYIVWPAGSQLQVYDHQGRQRIEVPMDSGVSAGGVNDGNRIFIPVHYFKLSAGRILAMDLSDHRAQEVWQLQRSSGIASAPAVRDHVLYAADTGGDVFAVSTAADRQPVWGGEHVFDSYAPVEAGLKVDDSGLYVASTDTTLYCLDRNTAKIKWQWLSGRRLADAPILTKTTVYQPLPDHQLAAIDKTSQDPQAYNRKPRWMVNVRQFLSADASHAYVLGLNRRLLALNIETGELMFRSQRADFAAVAVNSKSAVIYAATGNGRITAITPVLTAGQMGSRQ